MGFAMWRHPTQFAQFIVLIVFTPFGIAVTVLRFVATRRSGRRPGLEDWLAAVAALFFVLCNFGALMCKKTRKRSWNQWSMVGLYMYFMQALTFKLSVLALYYRIFSVNRAYRVWIWVLAAGQGVLIFLCCVLQSQVCHPFARWFDRTVPGTCKSDGLLIVAAETPNSVIDFAMVALAIMMVRNLQLSAIVKWRLGFLFGLGALVGIVGFIKVAITFSTADVSLFATMVAGLPAEGNVAVEERQSFNTSKLAYYPASKSNCRGIGVLVIPGGGYNHVSLTREGSNSTQYLNSRGYDAWVLDYSTRTTAPTPLYPVPQNEALGAVEHIRGLNKVQKLGVWGYSAGGHLAAITLTNPDADVDFGILAYPVITMDSALTHEGSRTNLLGENPSPELIEKMSAEKHVTASTPPVFVFHSANDQTVPVGNTLLFINALNANKVPFQTLIIPDGPHGIGLAFTDPKRNWEYELDRWFKYSI
ncbi:Endo-1,4-beta-xylanase B [Paramyrothecium foliicola]|nr:Endo-1,4-beta-xylanase B [Paramyrothecium foliicola]